MGEQQITLTTEILGLDPYFLIKVNNVGVVEGDSELSVGLNVSFGGGLDRGTAVELLEAVLEQMRAEGGTDG